MILDDMYGFEHENKCGIDSATIAPFVDLSKIIVIGSNIDFENEKNRVAKLLYSLILNMVHEKSDGVVLFDEDKMSNLGINFVCEDGNLNHFAAGFRTNIERALKKVLKR